MAHCVVWQVIRIEVDYCVVLEFMYEMIYDTLHTYTLSVWLNGTIDTSSFNSAVLGLHQTGFSRDHDLKFSTASIALRVAHLTLLLLQA